MTYPTIRPEITLDFANSRQLDPRITFSRTSGATYLNPDTGLITLAGEHEARFEKEGLLIEESRTNSLTYSVDFSQQWEPYWSSITANSTVAPDGTSTATTLIEDTARDFHLISGFSYTSGVPQNGDGTHTLSVFAKAKERSVIAISTNGSQKQYAVATFDLSSGVVSQYGTGDEAVDYVGSSIISVGNGWYRCTLTYSSVGNVWPNIEILNTPTYTYNNYGRNTYQGDGTSGVYIWGAQMEQNSTFPTSLIPTAGQTGGVIRDADICTIQGDNFSSWYNQNESTFTLYFNPIEFKNQGGITDSINLGPSRMEFMETGKVYVQGPDSAQFLGSTSMPAVLNEPNRYAYGFEFPSGSLSLSRNGVDTLSSTPGTALGIPTHTELRFSGVIYQNRGISLNGHFSRLAYYPRRLSDSELQTLTL